MRGTLTPHTLGSTWNFEPSILIPIAISVVIYLWGIRNIWQHAGVGRGINKRHYVSCLGALLALLLAFVSPLDALSDVLFSAHMVQHLILMLIVAPLLVMSDFPLAFLWALPRTWAQGLAYRLNQSQT